MQTIRVSATKARNEFFSLLNLVVSGKSIIVEKDKKDVAKVSPVGGVTKEGNKGLIKALKRASRDFVYSVWDNPLRRPGATSFLGRWDK